MGASNKKNLHPELRIWAGLGDKILAIVVTKLCNKYCEDPKERGNINLYLNSNSFITKFDTPLKIKGFPANLGDNIKGDIVEANIAFIYLNYGYVAAERYVTNNIIKQLKKITNE